MALTGIAKPLLDPCDDAGGAAVKHIVRTGAGHTVYSSAVAGMAPTPTVPGGTAIGDVYVNTLDGLTWIYGPNPTGGGFSWLTQHVASKNTITRGAIVYVGKAAFNPAAIAAPFYGMDPTSLPSPGATEPFGGDIYISTESGDITVLAGPSPAPMAIIAQAGRQQRVYVGVLPFSAPLPAGTLPDPLVDQPFPGDIYISSSTGDVTVMS